VDVVEHLRAPHLYFVYLNFLDILYVIGRKKEAGQTKAVTAS